MRNVLTNWVNVYKLKVHDANHKFTKYIPFCSNEWYHTQGATWALARLPGASKIHIRASILKDQEITVAQIRLKVYCEHTTCNTKKKKKKSFWGKEKCHSGKCVLLNLYFTCPNGQVVIKTYVAPCIHMKSLFAKTDKSIFVNF